MLSIPPSVRPVRLIFAAFFLALAGCGGGNRSTPTPAREGSNLLVFTVFVGSGPDTCMQVVRMKPDGTERKALTAKDKIAADPALSDDGKRIAYVAYEEERGGGFLFVMNADGTEPKKLPIKPERGEFLAPSWSPDGKRIAVCTAEFNWKGSSLSPRLYIVDADGSNLKRLDKADGLLPTWSPDGKQLLFTREEDNGREAPTLCIVDADGANVRPLVKNGAMMGAFAPDGKSLAYVVLESLHVRGEASGLFVAKADGSEPKRLAGSPDETIFGVQWSADGKRLFFTRRAIARDPRGKDPGRPDPVPEPPTIHVIDVDGKNLRRVTTENEPEFLGGTHLLATLLMRRG